MNTNKKSLFTALLIVLLLSSPVMAGRGGGGGGGFHSGGGGFHSGGGGGEYRGGGYRGSEFHGDRYDGGAERSSISHTPSFNTPHSNFTPSRSTGSWANVGARSGLAEHPNNFVRADFGANTGHNIHPAPGPHPGPGPHPDWYHGNWHDHWNHPWYNWPVGWWGAGYAMGAALTTPWSWGYWSYDNPYCLAPVVENDATIDYAQPIVTAAAPDAAPDQFATLLDAARDVFAQGDYAAALTQCDKAIALQPNDTVPHEFRGLALFALGRYKEAAGTIYAVLSVGPGWDWTTLSSLYPDIDVYTEQLRALEQYVNAHPNEAEARFLLAYHYMTSGYADAAARQLKAVVQLNPKDRLSTQLLSTLTTTDAVAQPSPSAPAKPVEASALVGNWTASRPDGATITLNLAKDAKYTWKFAQKDKPQKFSGDYAVADNLLILKTGANPVMVGQVTLLADGRFNFKLPGNSPSDPGLTFSK